MKNFIYFLIFSVAGYASAFTETEEVVFSPFDESMQNTVVVAEDSVEESRPVQVEEPVEAMNVLPATNKKAPSSVPSVQLDTIELEKVDKKPECTSNNVEAGKCYEDSNIQLAHGGYCQTYVQYTCNIFFVCGYQTYEVCDSPYGYNSYGYVCRNGPYHCIKADGNYVGTACGCYNLYGGLLFYGTIQVY